MTTVWEKLAEPMDDIYEHALPQAISVQKESARVA